MMREPLYAKRAPTGCAGGLSAPKPRPYAHERADHVAAKALEECRYRTARERYERDRRRADALALGLFVATLGAILGFALYTIRLGHR